jgi:hypothetical protein
MIGAVDEIKMKNKEGQHTQKQEQKNNGSADPT